MLSKQGVMLPTPSLLAAHKTKGVAFFFVGVAFDFLFEIPYGVAA